MHADDQLIISLLLCVRSVRAHHVHEAGVAKQPSQVDSSQTRRLKQKKKKNEAETKPAQVGPGPVLTGLDVSIFSSAIFMLVL